MNKEVIKIDNQLRQMAIDASNKAYSPYSKAKVGAALLTSSGLFYSGCNVENASYGGTVCAERVAIFKAVSESKISQKLSIKKIYIYTIDGWPPCGFCRQIIAEFASENLEVIIGDIDNNEKTIPFNQLLPHQFSSKHLDQL